MRVSMCCVVTVASFLYNNLSSLLVPDDSSQSVVSPVLSAAVCVDCHIKNLTEPVVITFDVENSKVIN